MEEDKNQEMAMFGGGGLEGGSGEDGSGLDAEGGESSTGTTTTSLAPKFNKTVDVFISYRRSNGSQLASLLKGKTTMQSPLSWLMRSPEKPTPSQFLIHTLPFL